jgi:hypothetical protein
MAFFVVVELRVTERDHCFTREILPNDTQASLMLKGPFLQSGLSFFGGE